jgi:hypothetical protein
VFGHLFPPFFKNWWSDDWISTVYGAEHTFRPEDVQIKHNVNAQKTSGITRYAVDQVLPVHFSGLFVCGRHAALLIDEAANVLSISL